ncbi:protein disulfide-isomerase A4-like [Ochlerotatus camptorhynchus]|uniref:protein disulfide-isomerase A4-like n=1 Tax=Ochlerotatus camptorhynchus TaxID=644619 RepID=UPI0031E1F375
MKLVLLALVLSISSPSWGYFPSENGVLLLDPSNFNAAARQLPYLMVEFYAPWCHYCKTFASKYENVAQQLATGGSPVALAKLDAIQYADFAAKHDVEEYPTLKFYRYGVPTVYEEELEVDPLMLWLIRNSQQQRTEWQEPVLELSSESFQSTIQINPFVLVEFYAPGCSHCQAFAPIYLKIAKEMAWKNPSVKLAKVDVSKERQLAAVHGIRRFPTIKLYRYGVSLAYNGPRDEHSVVNWLLSNV